MHLTSAARTKTDLHILFVAIVLLSASNFLACSGATQESHSEAVVLLISIDGFRWDYQEKAPTPNLDFFIDTGVHAKSLIPVFPTKTFPNHYTIVTGLYPENHGIISNNMYDHEIGDRFSMDKRAAVQDGRWWHGEPIWVTAHRHGLKTASYYWPGSEAEIGGVRPTHWFQYDGQVTNTARVDQVLAWLELPDDERPSFITLYFSLVDDVGHDEGPDSEEIKLSIKKVDDLLGYIRNEMNQRRILDRVNVIIVSDHGMVATSEERVIFLDDYVDLSTVEVIDWSPVVAINPKPGSDSVAYRRLKNAHPHLKIYRKDEIPPRFHYQNHARIPAILGLADEGWSVTNRKYFKQNSESFNGGQHGYDNVFNSMNGLFVARGPAFKQGLQVDSFENVHIYELMAEILGLQPAPNDGDLTAVKHMLR